MKKMKRFLGIITAMIMAVTMLAGCGGNGKGNSDSTEGNTLKFGCFSYSESLDPANMINAAGVTAVMVLENVSLSIKMT